MLEPDVLQTLLTTSKPPSTKMRASAPGSSQKPMRLWLYIRSSPPWTSTNGHVRSRM